MENRSPPEIQNLQLFSGYKPEHLLNILPANSIFDTEPYTGLYLKELIPEHCQQQLWIRSTLDVGT